MIQIIAGLQGAGKTKSLIDLANAEAKTTHGHIVYVDADNSHILQLSHKIRLIKPDDYPLETPGEFLVLSAESCLRIMTSAQFISTVC